MRTIEITEKLYVDQDGTLCLQHPGAGCPRTLSHQHRTRCNNTELTLFMQSLTGLDQEQIGWMSIEMAMDWLAEFVTVDEGDIYRLLADREIMGWWKNHWNARNEGMRLVILDWYDNVYYMATESGYTAAECRKMAQREALEKFTKLHRLAFVKTTYQCRHLEDSYAKLW